ncbi:acyl-CoA carboxylase subunit epsilon [Streptomyces sp. NPDC058274]|uniref:acyl-CoA carboxylase subunit epsilon n=1 Tax=Streptomyces sp. NPDC058274 TaxID=3346416 RepID=UPI0036E4C6CB
MSNETHITVVRGQPDEVELAAVSAVLLALSRRLPEVDEATLAAYADWTVKGGRRDPAAGWPRRRQAPAPARPDDAHQQRGRR